jgi:hypothetical protein
MKKPHFYQMEAQKKLKTRGRIRTNAMAINILKLLDEGVHPILDLHGHGARQCPLLCLHHHRL